MHVSLIAVGLVVAIAAIGSTIGFASTLLSGEGPESVGGWLGCIALQAVLYALAAGILYLASRSARKERLRQLAEERDRANRGSVSFVCSQCGDTNLVQGPSRWWTLGTSWGCVARCLTCGQRTPCPEVIWDQLPESVLGVLAGLASTACLIDSLLALPAFLGAVVGAWWLGRRFFPPARKAGIRCVRCGYDLRWLAEPRCPECGTEFDPELLTAQTHRTLQSGDNGG